MTTQQQQPSTAAAGFMSQQPIYMTSPATQPQQAFGQPAYTMQNQPLVFYTAAPALPGQVSHASYCVAPATVSGSQFPQQHSIQHQQPENFSIALQNNASQQQHYGDVATWTQEAISQQDMVNSGTKHHPTQFAAQPHFQQPIYYIQPQQQMPLSQSHYMEEPQYMSWRQKKRAFGRSDRLRQLADELTKKDQQTVPQQSMHYHFSDYHIEKDNSSTSEISKSNQADGPPNVERPGAFQRIPSTPVNNLEDIDQDENNPNQTVSEILSMLSGSAGSTKEGQAPHSAATAKNSTAAGGLNHGFNDYLMQDQAIQEIRMVPKQGAASAVSLKDINVAAERQPERRRVRPVQKDKKKEHPVILAEDEETDKQVYYDKSSCMHAPKAVHVPIF